MKYLFVYEIFFTGWKLIALFYSQHKALNIIYYLQLK